MGNVGRVRPLPGIVGIDNPGVVSLSVSGNRQQRLVAPPGQHPGVVLRRLLPDNLFRLFRRDLPYRVLRIRHIREYGSNSGDSRPVFVHDQFRDAAVDGQVPRLLPERVDGQVVLCGANRVQNQHRGIVAAQPVHHAAHGLQRDIFVCYVLIERLVDHRCHRFGAVQH